MILPSILTSNKVNYYALEVGSRGYISPENQSRLKHFIKGLHINNKYSHIKDNICKVALLASLIHNISF